MSDVMHYREADRKAALAQLFDRSSPTYERVGVEHFNDLGRRLVAHAGVAAGHRVLDVGCGTGAVLIPAARAAGPDGEVIGVDLSGGMVARAQEEAARQGLRQVRAVVGDAETVALEDIATAPGSFDTVLAGICLFFFPRPQTAVARYRELLKPGGRFGVSWWGRPDPLWDPVYAASAPYGRGPSSHTLPATSPFRSVDALHAMLAEAGFAEAETAEEDCVTHFANAEQWWRWVWSTAGRQFWESVPDDERAKAVAAVNAKLDSLKAPDGSLTMTSKVRFTLAKRS
ncbi:methyltransferase domain-containing protein [Streptomyces scopuliridis]|uniref:Methyltransferase domain-containing protein n=1 Tax=Streptomyces scopuliridis TaxID=452529 RepID=A0ACD4ZG80_9ACTN|nr:methyltransferase domain-containing protein [Streptomyces scopuliridis]WSB96166.1 methyltransferase domain-containing protein [Streptomyces scopuliridis]WSC10128.1 methyltransferase domain-containing protein [Streptomyces scopuliridis]